MNKIVFTHSINSIVSKFTSLFLAIYFLKITNGNVISVVSYYLFKYSLNGLFSFLSLKTINKNNVLNVYRLGLLSNAICLFILLILGKNVVDYIYLYAAIDCSTSVLYWSAYKMILYCFKSDEQFKKIFSYNSVVSSIISIISTIGMGYIIVNASYSIVISIIIALVLIALIMTFNFDKYEFNINKIKLSNIKYTLKDKQSQQIYKMVFFEGMGFRGGLDTTVTLIIFLTLGSESSLGNLNALFGLLGLITSLLVKKYIKEEHNKKSFIISALSILIVTIPIIFTSSFTMFIIYNVVFNIAYKITQILVDTAVFNIHSNETIKKYYLEYTFVGETIHGFGKALSELILLIAVMYSFNITSLRIVAAILSCSIILQTFVYNNINRNNNLNN